MDEIGRNGRLASSNNFSLRFQQFSSFFDHGHCLNIEMNMNIENFIDLTQLKKAARPTEISLTRIKS